MAAPKYVIDSATLKHNASGLTAPVTKPNGLANGDMYVVHMVLRSVSVNVTPPSAQGWQEVPFAVKTLTNVMHRTYYKTVTDAANEPAEPTWNLDVGTVSTTHAFRVTGHDPNSPINTHDSTSSSAASFNIPRLTTTVAETLLLAFYGLASSVLPTTAYVGATTIFRDFSGSGGTSNRVSAAWEATHLPVGQTADPFAITGTSSPQVAGWIAVAPTPPDITPPNVPSGLSTSVSTVSD